HPVAHRVCECGRPCRAGGAGGAAAARRALTACDVRQLPVRFSRPERGCAHEKRQRDEETGFTVETTCPRQDVRQRACSPCPRALPPTQKDRMPPLLEVRGLHTEFRTGAGVVRAVDGISYTVEAGETVAVVGESGSGKSVGALSILRLIPNPPGR